MVVPDIFLELVTPDEHSCFAESLNRIVSESGIHIDSRSVPTR